MKTTYCLRCGIPNTSAWYWKGPRYNTLEEAYKAYQEVIKYRKTTGHRVWEEVQLLARFTEIVEEREVHTHEVIYKSVRAYI